MKRILSLLLATVVLVGTSGVFTSCQEDAPEINYTINVTVKNDFTEVLNSINSGSVKQTEAVNALLAAITKMQGSEETRFQTLANAIDSLATSMAAKLAVLEASIKAPLDIESKLGLIEVAINNIPNYSEAIAEVKSAIENAPTYDQALKEIKDATTEAAGSFSTQYGLLMTAIQNLPDYGNQLQVIKETIKVIPDYGDQITIIMDGLSAVKTQGKQNADALATLKSDVAGVLTQVQTGNITQNTFLTQIWTFLSQNAVLNGPAQRANTIIVDGVEKAINATLSYAEWIEDKESLVENILLRVNIVTTDHDVFYFEIQNSDGYGRIIDLTHTNTGWNSMAYYKLGSGSSEGQGQELVYFKCASYRSGLIPSQGTLYMDYAMWGTEVDRTPYFVVLLQNCRIPENTDSSSQWGDGKAHTISINFGGALKIINGTMEKYQLVAPASID